MASEGLPFSLTHILVEFVERSFWSILFKCINCLGFQKVIRVLKSLRCVLFFIPKFVNFLKPA